MKELITNHLVLHYQDGLENFIKNSLKIVETKLPFIKELFKNDDIDAIQLKASFFTKRNEFVKYIKSISSGHTPPSWATGCFYNGEIQTLIDINDKNDLTFKVHTLTHEMVHLYIQKFIYEKFNLDRIRWFDESYASFIDGHIEYRNLRDLKAICYQLKSLGDFDMNFLDDVKNVKTNTYDGYDMFLIIGKYIFENNLAKEYMELLKKSPNEIRRLGTKILPKAIQYIEKI